MTMKERTPAIFLVMCSLAAAGSVVYADLKKGYYSPAELGSVGQPAPVELSLDSNYQASAYPVPAADLAPGRASRRSGYTVTPVTAHDTSPCSRHSLRRHGKPR